MVELIDVVLFANKFFAILNQLVICLPFGLSDGSRMAMLHHRVRPGYVCVLLWEVISLAYSSWYFGFPSTTQASSLA